MISLGRFFRFIEPLCPGVPEPLMAQTILGACIEFCEETDVIQLVDTQDLRQGVAGYALPSATQQDVARVLTAFAGPTQLHPTAVDDVRQGGAARSEIDSAIETPQGSPQQFYVPASISDGSIYLYPVPDATKPNALAIRVSFRPTEDATSVADALYDSYRPAIVAGTMAALFAMPTLPGYSERTARERRETFMSAIASARGDARRGPVRSGLRVQPRKF